MKSAPTVRLVSVILPVFNCQDTIAEAIKSILLQSYREMELIVINDGSTDNSLAIAQQLQAEDDRIKITSQANGGIVAALNAGISAARGDFIARMDGDDISHPMRIAEQVAYLESHPSVALIGTFYTEIPSGRRCEMPLGSKAVMYHLRNNGNALVHSSVMMRADICREVGGYRDIFPHGEDYDLWLRIAERHLIDNIPLYLIDYRRLASSVSQRNLEQQFLSAIGARRCAALRKNGFPDPASTARAIDLTQLAAWGLRTDDVCSGMIEWLRWNKTMLSETQAPETSLENIQQGIEKYALLRAEIRESSRKRDRETLKRALISTP